MPTSIDRLTSYMFRASVAALLVFLILVGLGLLADPPLARRSDPIAQAWQWLILSTVAGGSLTGIVTFFAAITAAVSRRFRPKMEP